MYKVNEGKFSTLCGDCVFAQYEIKDEGPVQFGCVLGRIAKFKNKGNVTTVNETTESGPLSYYEIDRICTTMRPKNSNWKHENSSVEEQKKAARKEVQLNLDVLLVFDENTNFDEILLTLHSLEKQTLPPHNIFIIDKQKKIPAEQIRFSLRPINLNWFYTKIYRNCSNEDSWDEVKSKLDCSYFAVVKSGYQVPPDTIEKIDRALNDELERFALLESPEIKVIQTDFYKHPAVGGSNVLVVEEEGKEKIYIKGIAEKIKELSKDEGSEHFVKRLEELK